MNVARKSTTKLPQKWAKDKKLESREDEGDSGIGCTDSADSFQDAMFNLKVLSGSGDMADLDRSEVQEAQNTSGMEKVGNGASHGDATVPKRNAEDQDILEQIDDLVNEKENLKAESTKEMKAEGSEEDDDILIIKDDESKESGKGSNGVPDSKTKNVLSKTPIKIGEKVRSTVHSIMSKLVQSNPDVNNLLSKVKSEDSADSGDSSGASRVPLRQSKGNLFDNFDVSDTDSKSSAADNKKSPQQSIVNNEGDMVLGETAQDGSENGEREPKESVAEKTVVDSTTEEPLSSEPGDSKASLENHSKGSSETDLKSASSVGSDSCEVTVDKKCDRVNKLDSSPQNDPVIESSVDKKDSDDSSIKNEKTAKSESEEKPSPSDSGVEPSECKAETDASKSEPVETVDSISCDKMSSEVLECDPEVDKTSAPDRKRSLDNACGEEEDSQPPKRSRLDEVIGKLGERVTFPADVPGIDLDEYEDSPLGDADSVEFKQLEEISGSTTDEEEYKAPEPKPQTITIKKEELEALITASAKKAIEQYHSPEVSTLTKRIEELQEGQEEWRQKAKNLERQVLDLTVLQQRLEKRKAHTAALKSITTRSIGIWVTEDKFLKTVTPQKPPGNKTPPATPPITTVGQLMWNPSQSTVRSVGAEVPAASGGVSVTAPPRNTSVAHLLSQTARMPTVASCAAANRSVAAGRPIVTGPRPAGSTTSPAGGQGASPAAARGLPSSTVAPASSLVLVSNVPAGATGSKTVPAQQTTTVVTPAGPAQVKVIDLTVEDDPGAPKQGAKVVGGVRAMAPQQVVRQITPVPQTAPGAGSSTILLSSPAGTQIVNSGNITRPGMLQVVTIANAQNIRPGSILTVMGSQTGGVVRPPATAATFTTSSRDSAPLVMTQQLPGGVTFVRPPVIGNNASARPALTTLTAGATSVVASRTPVALATAQPHAAAAASGPLQPDGSIQPVTSFTVKKNHPAPLPENICPKGLPADLKPPPPSPGLKISRVKQGIVLSWNMSIPSDCVEIASYQLFAYQETSAVPQTSLWKKVGDVKALPLPMACTLTQFQDGNKYHFAVRAIDIHGRSGPFSEPSYIYLTKAA